jgi:hypothetical protein
VLELLQQQLITKMEAQIRGVGSTDVWNDVSLMLLAVVAFAAKDLKEEEEISIVRILQIICVEGVPDKVLENCSNVLKYVSVRFAPFEHLSPVVRSILNIAIAEREDVIENLSNVLYNMTCSSANIDRMLKDSEYVDTMIHIMRNGNLEVQENIAQCMRNFAANPKCVEILLRTDILSDLIVIALLRTSSEEIKVVCSEAFYNMLCHDGTRLRLLKGDLWWAVMRLCRTDSDQVRNTCARALFDLSTEACNVAPLRVHHILSFVRDISSTGSEEFLHMCMRSVHNLVRQYGVAGDQPIANNEVIATIRIGTQMLSRMTQLNYVRDTIVLLLHCAHPSTICEGAAQEFVHLYIVDVFDRTKAIWGTDRQCRIYVSRLLWELSKCDAYTKVTHVSDLDSIMGTCFQQDPPFEICDNLCAALLQHMQREKVPASHIIKLPIWHVLLHEGLSNESVVLAGASAAIGASKRFERSVADPLSSMTKSMSINRNAAPSLGAFRERSATNFDAREPADPLVERLFNTRSAVLSLLAYCIRELIADAPENITRGLVQGVLQYDLLDHPASRVNVLVVVSALSGVSAFTGFLLDGKILQLLHRHLMSAVGSPRYASAQEFCSAFLRNLSLHSALVPRYVSSADGMICELIRELLEVPNPVVHLDLAVFFFNSANHLVKSELSVNPKFVLDMIGKISNIESESDNDVTAINKFTISMVLNKYSFGSGVEPNYVQYMFSYMQHPSSQHTPSYIESASYTYAVDLNVTLVGEFYANKESPSIELKTFPPEANLWSPTITSETKRHENIILKFAHSTSVVHAKVELLDAAPSSAVVFNKIFKEFEALKESIGATDNNAIAEADEEFDEDDEEEGLEEGLREEREAGVRADVRAGGLQVTLEESSVSSTSSSIRGTPRVDERSVGSFTHGGGGGGGGNVNNLPTLHSNKGSFARLSDGAGSVTGASPGQLSKRDSFDSFNGGEGFSSKGGSRKHK